MNIYAGLLFNQGHVQDPGTARMLADVPEPTPKAPDNDRPRRGDTAPGTRAYAAELLQGRRWHGWVELETVLLASLR